MAQTIHFADGTREVLLQETPDEFATMLEDRLGADVARYFRELVDQIEEGTIEY